MDNTTSSKFISPLGKNLSGGGYYPIHWISDSKDGAKKRAVSDPRITRGLIKN